MLLSAITGTSTPEATDPPAGHTQMTNIVTNLERYAVGRFATTGARDAAIPAPTDGMIAVVVNKIYMRLSGAWVALAGGFHATAATLALTTVTAASTATLSLPPGAWMLWAKSEIAFTGVGAGAGGTLQLYNGTAASVLDKAEIYSTAVGPWRHPASCVSTVVLSVTSVIRVNGLASSASGTTLDNIKLSAVAVSSIN